MPGVQTARLGAVVAGVEVPRPDASRPSSARSLDRRHRSSRTTASCVRGGRRSAPWPRATTEPAMTRTRQATTPLPRRSSASTPLSVGRRRNSEWRRHIGSSGFRGQDVGPCDRHGCQGFLPARRGRSTLQACHGCNAASDDEAAASRHPAASQSDDDEILWYRQRSEPIVGPFVGLAPPLLRSLRLHGAPSNFDPKAATQVGCKGGWRATVTENANVERLPWGTSL